MLYRRDLYKDRREKKETVLNLSPPPGDSGGCLYCVQIAAFLTYLDSRYCHYFLSLHLCAFAREKIKGFICYSTPRVSAREVTHRKMLYGRSGVKRRALGDCGYPLSEALGGVAVSVWRPGAAQRFPAHAGKNGTERKNRLVNGPPERYIL